MTSKQVYTKYVDDLESRTLWIIPPKNTQANMDRWGKERLALGLIVRDLLNKLAEEEQFVWFIDGGTLLGAWRSGSFIKSDDDFDIGLFVKDYDRDYADDMCNKISSKLPQPYQCRMVTDYCDKLEVYDPTQGKYVLEGEIYNGADFHNVTVDLQFYMCNPSGKTNNVCKLLHKFTFARSIPTHSICPTQQIVLEGHMFNAPCSVVVFLEAIYGYLGKDYRYDQTQGVYVKNK